MWTLIARVLAIPAVANWLIEKSKARPYTHITSPDGTDVYMYRNYLKR